EREVSPAAPAERPSGVVTFLLTDIVGSTRMWESCPETMPDVLDRHDELVRNAVEGNRGYTVKTRGEGDSTFSAFDLATDAAAAALEALVAVINEPWPQDCPIHVRMALHTGEALERHGDYFGRTVNRVARLRAVAGPDQVLVSQATAQLLLDHLPEGAHLEELGSRQLRDFDRPETVYRLAPSGLAVAAGAVAGVAGGSGAGRTRPPAERRQLTVLVCGFADSGATESRPDPEELQIRLEHLRQRCAAIIEPLSGYLTPALGNTVVALWGFPYAHEDDAIRAVRAGLQLVADTGLAVGVDTGLTVVGYSGEDEGVVETVGDPPIVAARLQEVAAAGTVVLSDTTSRLVRGWVELKSLGELWLRGVARGVALFRAVAETAAVARIDAAAQRGWTPFVGRSTELDTLIDRWATVQQGGAEVVVITGEPGIGKSRLVRTVAEAAPGLSEAIELRCSPDHQSTPLHPVTPHLASVLGELGLDALKAHLAGAGIDDPEALPLLAAVAGIEPGSLEPSEPVSRRSSRTVDFLRETLAPPAQRPILLTVEDLQWADPTTIELVARFIEPDPLPGVLVVLTCRPEFAAPWPVHPHVTHLVLNRLTTAQVETMIQAVAGEDALDDTTVREIIRRTEGVPLFVEEFTTSLLRDGDSDAGGPASRDEPAPAVPATLHDSLMARLDRVGSARRVMQLASVLGREFDQARLVELVDDPAALPDNLDTLVAADLLYRRASGSVGAATFCFKHMLIRDAAYESLLRSERRRLHAQVAEGLEGPAQEPQEIAIHPEVVARHWAAAGEPLRAITWWRRASRSAENRGALTEAVDASEAAMKLIAELPPSEERDRIQLRLALRLILLLNSWLGSGNERTGAMAALARELARQVGSPVEQTTALVGGWVHHFDRGELRAAADTAAELVEVAAGEELVGLIARMFHGIVHFELGELAAARQALDEGMSMWKPDFVSVLEMVVGYDVSMVLWTELAWIDWHEGYPDRALGLFNSATERVPAPVQAWSRAFLETSTATFHWLRREPQLALAHADACAPIASRAALDQITAHVHMLRGWALSEMGESGDHATLIRQGLQMLHRLGVVNAVERGHAMLAIALRNAGRLDDAFVTITEGQSVSTRVGTLRTAHDLWRLEGEMRAALGEPTEQAAPPIRHAIDVARTMGSRMMEVRALTSLARLLPHDAGVRAQLSTAVASLSGGTDTPDVRDATALIGQVL
ncbi:MAG TPA: AAA family ATPase, partial [Acidimicrobiales bacterium]